MYIYIGIPNRIQGIFLKLRCIGLPGKSAGSCKAWGIPSGFLHLQVHICRSIVYVYIYMYLYVVYVCIDMCVTIHS